MDDLAHRVVADDLGDESLVAHIANDKRHRFRQCRAKASRQIVDDDDRLAGIRQRMNQVAADIAAPAGDQYGHEPDPLAI